VWACDSTHIVSPGVYRDRNIFWSTYFDNLCTTQLVNVLPYGNGSTQVTFLIEFIYSFVSRSRIFHSYWDVTIVGEGLQNSVLFQSHTDWSLSNHTCCDTELWFFFFWSHPKEYLIQSPLATHTGMWRIYCNPDPHGSNTRWKDYF
jgi:hypothetical protein